MGASWIAEARASLRPPPKLTLSEWADMHFRLSAESAAEPGRWHTLPYQRGILDAITDPGVERVSVMKSARVGFTKCINAAIAFFISHDPCPILLVQPTVEDAEGYSKEEIAPMLRDVEALAGLVSDERVKTSAQTILHKSFPGGVLSMVGANSGRGFRRISRRVVFFDEVDAYPTSAGNDGDPIKLGEKRAEYYWNRKIISGSTPLISGASRIEELYESGDRRRYYVPCPHCGHMDYLSFREEKSGGHYMRWPEGNPAAAFFVCRSCGCTISEDSKRSMIERGQWRAEAPFRRHASFRIWAAYSLSPNAGWGQIAAEFVEAKALGPEKLKTYVNTTLGEPWQERGEAPDYERLLLRRLSYAVGTCPVEPVVITAGVDVQRDRFVFEIVAWLADRQSYSVDAGSLWGDTALSSTWGLLDKLLMRSVPCPDGDRQISMLGIDSSNDSQTVYHWAKNYPFSRVIACKGVSGWARPIISSPSPVELRRDGKRIQRGYRIWPVGVDAAKSELYGWLRLSLADDGAAPPGFCHFPELDRSFFRELTAEHLVRSVDRRTNRARMEWQVIPGRENHHLDARILARVAAAVLGIDRAVAESSAPKAARPENGEAAAPAEKRAPWVSTRDEKRRTAGWLSRRR